MASRGSYQAARKQREVERQCSTNQKREDVMEKLIEMYVKMRSMVQDEEGATMVEYALMVALIAVVGAVTAATLGTDISAKFTEISGKLNP